MQLAFNDLYRDYAVWENPYSDRVLGDRRGVKVFLSAVLKYSWCFFQASFGKMSGFIIVLLAPVSDIPMALMDHAYLEGKVFTFTFYIW